MVAPDLAAWSCLVTNLVDSTILYSMLFPHGLYNIAKIFVKEKFCQAELCVADILGKR